MPAHEWTRVDAGIFHDFHLSWVVELSRVLNQGVLPTTFYSLIEPQPGDAFAFVKYGGAARPVEAGDVGGIDVECDPPLLAIRRATDPAGVYASLRRSIAIRRVGDDRVVARIELTTPGNKRSARAVRAFVDPVTHATEAGFHLLIVDLFPPRRHDPGGLCNAAFEAMGGEPFPLPADRHSASQRTASKGRGGLTCTPSRWASARRRCRTCRSFSTPIITSTCRWRRRTTPPGRRRRGGGAT